MIARNGNSNFFVAHYDWIAAAVGVAALAAAGFFFVQVLGEDANEAADQAVRRIESRKPDSTGVKPAEMEEFNRVLKFAKTPLTMGEISEKVGSFLASERRVFCSKAECRAPIQADAKVCPVCGEKQEEVKVVYDTDGDGLPDEWEKRYGLNANDAGDAGSDLDGDGFSNAEEFEAKTDPSDKDSHPDYLDSLKLVLPLKQTYTTLMFVGTYKTPGGVKYIFKDPKRVNDYDRGNYSVLEGEPIGKSGFVVKGYEAKTRKVKIGGGMEKSEDVSEAVVQRERDGKVVRLVVNNRKTPTDVQAKLVYERGNAKDFLVVPGDKIDLNGTKYVVKEIKSQGKGAAVTVEHETLGKIRSIEALEP